MEHPLPTIMPSGPPPRRKARRIRTALALVVLLIIPEALVILLQRSTHDSLLREGDTIPLLTLRGLDSDSLSLSDLFGRKVVLFFFSVGCERCCRELSSIERLSLLFKDRLVLVAISLGDVGRTRDALSEDRPGLMKLIDDNGEARRMFGIEEVPALILVNEDQTIRQQYIGEEPFEVLRKRLTGFAGRSSSHGRGDLQGRN